MNKINAARLFLPFSLHRMSKTIFDGNIHAYTQKEESWSDNWKLWKHRRFRQVFLAPPESPVGPGNEVERADPSVRIGPERQSSPSTAIAITPIRLQRVRDEVERSRLWTPR